MALIKCSECGKEISDKAEKCIHCGCPVIKEEKKKYCTECGNELKIDDKVCSKCGYSMDKKKEKNKSNKISFILIFRYIVGIFVLICSFSSVKSLGIVLCLISALLIIPYTANIIYKKININKPLKIIIPLVCFFLALCIFPKESSANKTLTCTLKASYEGYNVDGKQEFIFENNTLITYNNNSYMKFDDASSGETMFNYLDQNTETFNKYEGVTYKVTFNAKNELRTTINVNVTSAPEMFVSFLSYDSIDEKSSLNDIKSELEKDKYTCTTN